MINGGINYLAVACLDEAIKLREYNKDIPILVLEPIRIEFIDVCIDNNITITVSSLDYFEALCSVKLPGILKFHLKIDSGMSRLGFYSKKDIETVFSKLLNPTTKKYDYYKNLFLEGIYTHFATSGIHDKHWDNQLEKFKSMTSDIDLSQIPIVHSGGSLTLVTHKKIPFCNGIRLGIIMYGIDLKSKNNYTGVRGKLRKLKYQYLDKKQNISATTTTNNLAIVPAATLYSEIMEIRYINQNDFVGYGALFIASEKTKIATLPIGYADGIPRNLKHVSINGKKYNIVGHICMDMIMVTVDDSVKIHDKVIIWGGDLLPIKTVSKETGISSYSLFTGISSRVPRVYIRDNNREEISY